MQEALLSKPLPAMHTNRVYFLKAKPSKEKLSFRHPCPRWVFDEQHGGSSMARRSRQEDLWLLDKHITQHGAMQAILAACEGKWQRMANGCKMVVVIGWDWLNSGIQESRNGLSKRNKTTGRLWWCFVRLAWAEVACLPFLLSTHAAIHACACHAFQGGESQSLVNIEMTFLHAISSLHWRKEPATLKYKLKVFKTCCPPPMGAALLAILRYFTLWLNDNYGHKNQLARYGKLFY